MKDRRTPFQRWFDDMIAEALLMTDEEAAALPHLEPKPLPQAAIDGLQAAMDETRERNAREQREGEHRGV